MANARLDRQALRPETALGPRAAVDRCGTVPRWHVPLLGSDGACMPYLVIEDDSATLLLFTTRRKANQAVAGWIAPSIDVGVRAASCTPQAMSKLLSRLAARGIAWVRINHGPCSVRLPLEAVAGAIRQAAAVSALQPATQLFLLRDPVTPSAPLVEILHDQPCLRLYTDADRAQARALAMGSRLVSEPQQAVVALDSDGVHELLRELRLQGVEAIVLDGPGGGQWMGIDIALRDRLAA